MNKRKYALPISIMVVLFATICVTLFAQHSPEAAARPVVQQDGISVYFSPNGGCTDAIINQINLAQKSVKVQTYYFTSAPIAKALLEAKKRGVSVTVLLDSSQRTYKYSSATFFFNQSIPVFIDSTHAIAHSKVILIDDRVIITGSFNFTAAAEISNVENLLVIEGKADLFKAYAENFEHHLSHSVAYVPLVTEETTSKNVPIRPTEVPKEAKKDLGGDSTNETAAVTVYRTTSGGKYHREGCRYLSKSSFPISLKDAKGRGLGPCSRCSPPR